MKKLIPSISIILLSGLMLLAGCDNDENPTKNAKLPAATQEGKNTVGFTFEDGQVWVPYFECGLGMNPCGKASVNVSHPADAQRGIGLAFGKFTESSQSSLHIGNNWIGSVNSTGEKIDSIKATYRSYGSSSLTEYAFTQPGSSFLVTRFDRQAKIVSGTFHLILKESSGSRTITLSNGRFDYRFGACECDK